MKCSSETSVDFQLITRRYIPEDRTIYNYRYENRKSCFSFVKLHILSTQFSYLFLTILRVNISLNNTVQFPFIMETQGFSVR
jgi:hypothetical protein